MLEFLGITLGATMKAVVGACVEPYAGLDNGAGKLTASHEQ
jgi:hypothetical protein